MTKFRRCNDAGYKRSTEKVKWHEDLCYAKSGNPVLNSAEGGEDVDQSQFTFDQGRSSLSSSHILVSSISLSPSRLALFIDIPGFILWLLIRCEIGAFMRH